jgi:hypothetical protein
VDESETIPELCLLASHSRRTTIQVRGVEDAETSAGLVAEALDLMALPRRPMTPARPCPRAPPAGRRSHRATGATTASPPSPRSSSPPRPSVIGLNRGAWRKDPAGGGSNVGPSTSGSDSGSELEDGVHGSTSSGSSSSTSTPPSAMPPIAAPSYGGGPAGGAMPETFRDAAERTELLPGSLDPGLLDKESRPG